MVPPDHTLRQLRELAYALKRDPGSAKGQLAARELAELFLELDNTLCLGISLPRDWKQAAESHVKTYASIVPKV